MSSGRSDERRRRWSATGVLALLGVVAALRVAAPVFMPVALAIIIAFVLSPPTGWLELLSDLIDQFLASSGGPGRGTAEILE
jgi:predicted PurR-regulated permease PerM